MSIPKTIHQIWLGSPYPHRLLAMQRTWLELHSDWEYRLWTSEEDLFPLVNQRIYDHAKSWAQKADVLRYEILHRIGGFYVDVDFEARRSLDPLVSEQLVAGYQAGITVAIGLIGARPGHPVIDEVIRSIPASYALSPTVTAQTGPDLFSYYCRRQRHSSDVTLFDPPYFYPYLPGQDPRSADYSQSFAVHHWAASWIRPDGSVAQSRRRWKELRFESLRKAKAYLISQALNKIRESARARIRNGKAGAA